ncbi:MAG: DUF1883 domain-containing protein [Bacillus sp. (in: firmicutes)]
MHHYEFDLHMWDVIVLKLESKAEVKLMDEENYKKYSENQPIKYYGGMVTDKVYRIQAPNYGHWHLVIETGNAPSKHSIQIIRN